VRILFVRATSGTDVRHRRPLAGSLRYLAGLTAFISLYFGVEWIRAPTATAAAFGAPLPLAHATALTTYLALCGTHDLMLGVITAGCVLLGDRHGAGVLQVASALRAVGDGFIVVKYGEVKGAVTHFVVGALTLALARVTLRGAMAKEHKKGKVP
jgi:hypothetical protein